MASLLKQYHRISGCLSYYYPLPCIKHRSHTAQKQSIVVVIRRAFAPFAIKSVFGLWSPAAPSTITCACDSYDTTLRTVFCISATEHQPRLHHLSEQGSRYPSSDFSLQTWKTLTTTHAFQIVIRPRCSTVRYDSVHTSTCIFSYIADINVSSYRFTVDKLQDYSYSWEKKVTARTCVRRACHAWKIASLPLYFSPFVRQCKLIAIIHCNALCLALALIASVKPRLC